MLPKVFGLPGVAVVRLIDRHQVVSIGIATFSGQEELGSARSVSCPGLGQGGEQTFRFGQRGFHLLRLASIKQPHNVPIQAGQVPAQIAAGFVIQTVG